MHKRNIYLKLKSLEEARSIFLGRFDWGRWSAVDVVATEAAVGRVLAEPVTAAWSAPSYHGAAMDGIAVKAEDTYDASEASPVELTVEGQAHFVNTGDALPPGTNAVIMIEQVQVLDEGRVRIEAATFPWSHVRRVGEDIVATEILLTRYHLVRPYSVGALLAAGVTSVRVRRRPRVLIIPTGSEIVEADSVKGDEPEQGTIVEFNGTMLGKLVEEVGGTYERTRSMGDDADGIGDAIVAAVRGEFDAVLVIGGSSAGSHDVTRAAIERVGEVLVHGVTMMPGKPTLLCAVEDKPVVGIPGYPVSAIVAFEELVAPALARMQGLPASQIERETLLVEPTRKIASKLGMQELVRVRIGKVKGRYVATPLPRGAGVITSITRADGIIRIPAELEGLAAFEPVHAELLRSRSAIERNLVAVGSHDMCLDVLADLLYERGTGPALSSSHVGSLGGIMAIKADACHLAGTHLLDPTDGSYNTTYIDRYLPGRDVRLVHLVEREQGLIVRRGNPKGITGLADLARDDVTFINRQGGSGTRVLFDSELVKHGIDPAAIRGYCDEETTHMAVAVAVLSGAADAGMGILAAARALRLDFVPIASERYDLIIPAELFDDERIELLLAIIRGEEFARRAGALGGYDTAQSGEVLR